MGRDDYRRAVIERSRGYKAENPNETYIKPHPCDRVIIWTFFNSFSGFGRFAWKIGHGLEQIGVPVGYDAAQRDERYAPVDPWLLAHHTPNAPEPWRLLMDYYHRGARPRVPYVFFTMHESTRIHDQLRQTSNESRAVIVPTQWNAETFAASGVHVPIHVCPLGYDPGEGWTPNRRAPDGKFRALMVGMLPDGGVRKMFPLGIRAFIDAFHDRADVELVIKIWPGCRRLLDVPSDPRIKVIAESWPIERLVELTQSCDVLLNPTASEGWGLTTLESMACGVPPVITLASAHGEFVTPESAWVVQHKTEPAKGYYANQGDWFPPRYDDLVRALRDARENPDETRRKGDAAVERAKQFTWRQSAVKLRSILWEIGMLAKHQKPRVPLDRRDCIPCQAAKAQ